MMENFVYSLKEFDFRIDKANTQIIISEKPILPMEIVHELIEWARVDKGDKASMRKFEELVRRAEKCKRQAERYEGDKFKQVKHPSISPISSSSEMQ